MCHRTAEIPLPFRSAVSDSEERNEERKKAEKNIKQLGEKRHFRER